MNLKTRFNQGLFSLGRRSFIERSKAKQIAWGLILSLTALPLFANTKCTEDDTDNPVFGAECTSLSVLENPKGEQARKISLNIIRLPSIQETTKPPIFFIAGGPGQASTDLLDIFRLEFSKLLVNHDFVFVDQRGTGKSNPIHCEIDLLPHTHKSPTELEALNLERHRACLKDYDADLEFYTTPYAVSDLEDVRKHFGYEKIYLWGGSYGTRVVLEYLRSAESAIAGVILDGLAPYSIQLPHFVERDGSNALGQLFSICQNDTSCNQAFPDLEQSWLTVLQALKTSPKIETLVHPRTQKSHRVYIDDQVISGIVRTMLYSRAAAPILPLAIHNAASGDFSTLFSISAVGMDNMGDSISSGMQFAVLCAEDFHLSQQEKTNIEPFTRRLHLPPSSALKDICNLYPKSQLPAEYFSFANTKVPALVLSGKLDPVTPPVWGEAVANRLKNHRHIVVEGGHHIVSRAGCIPKIIRQFVKAPEKLQEIDAACVDLIKPPYFFIDNAGPELTQTNNTTDEALTADEEKAPVADTKTPVTSTDRTPGGTE